MFSTATTSVVKLSMAPMINVHQGPSWSPRLNMPYNRPRAKKNITQFLSSEELNCLPMSSFPR